MAYDLLANYIPSFGIKNDDQDFSEDARNNHRALFTQSLVQSQGLDKLAARFIPYHYFATFTNDQPTKPDRQTGVILVYSVQISMIKFMVLRVLEVVWPSRQQYFEEFYQRLVQLY